MQYIKSQFITELRERDSVASPFLIKSSILGVGKSGKPYLSLVLMDRTGEVDAKIWDDVTLLASQIVNDAFIWVEGRCQVYQGRKQIVIDKTHVLREDQVKLAEYVRESKVDVEALHKKLLEYVDSMEDEHYRALAQSVMKNDPEITPLLKRAPAAKSVHHAYKGGLLEHIVSITGVLDALSRHYGKLLNRDLLFLGGFFHDIGKLWELSYDRLTEYTTEGRLIGHLVMGVELVERKVQYLEKEGLVSTPFPVEKKLLVKHLILSHHGQLEYGSPKRPKTLEAIVVHAIDDLDSKLNSIHGFMEADQTPGNWTGLHRHMERFFLKGSTPGNTR